VFTDAGAALAVEQVADLQGVSGFAVDGGDPADVKV
jgi:hypothetical protein